MKQRKRIVVGPDALFVERGGCRSQVVGLTNSDTPAHVLHKATTAYEGMKRLVAFRLWHRHIITMAAQRRQADLIRAQHRGPLHAGPRPDLVATNEWRSAKAGEWDILPHGVVNRLLRAP